MTSRTRSLQFFNVLSLAAESLNTRRPYDCQRIRYDPAGKANGLLDMSKIVLPYELDYVGGREAEKRRRSFASVTQTRQSLQPKV
jgi:hypothetical protein